MKIIIICLLITALSSCGEKESYGFNYFIGQSFYITDLSGHDLLDPQTANAIDTTTIKIYYLINGQKIEFSKYHSGKGYVLQNQKGYSIDTLKDRNDNKYLMSITLNSEISGDNFAYSYIEWNKEKTDTIKSIVKREKNILSSTMVNYNDSAWIRTADNLTFTIVK